MDVTTIVMNKLEIARQIEQEYESNVEFNMTNPNWAWRPDGSMPGDAQLYEQFFMLKDFGKLLHWETLMLKNGTTRVTLEFTHE